MTFEEKFASLKKNFVTANTKKFGADFAIQFTMTDEDCGGTFYIEYKDNALNVEPYDYFDNTAYVNASAVEIAKLYKGTVSKSLEIGGNEEVVNSFAAAYKTVKKAPAKKATAKKTEVKKEEPKKAEVKKTAVKKADPKKAETAKKVAPKKEETKKATTATVAKKAEPAKKAEAPKKATK